MLSDCGKPTTFKQLLDRGWCTHTTILVQNLTKISRATKYLSGGGWKVPVNFDNYVYISILQKWKSMYSYYGERLSEYFAHLQCWAKHMRKVECYWEHVVEQNENLGSMIRNHWKLDGNRLGTKRSKKYPTSPHPPHTKKNWVYRYMLQILVGSTQFLHHRIWY